MPQSRLIRFALVALALGAVAPLSACIVDATGPGPGYVGRPPVGSVPVINALSANPSAITDGSTPITFTVNATDPTLRPLQYNWSATKGTLSATSGQTVSWSPTKADGSLEAPGLATVTVLISNGAQAVSGQLNLTIQGNGATQVSAGAATPPAASPSASPTPAPTPSPSVSPVASPSPTPSASASVAPSASPSVSPSPEASESPSPSPSVSASPAS